MSAFTAWWHREGSAIRPQPDEDIEQFARRITAIAWSNGQDIESQARQAAQIQVAELQERLNRADAEKCATEMYNNSLSDRNMDAVKPFTADVMRIMRDAGMTFHLGLPHEAVIAQMTRVVDLAYAEASIKAAAAFAAPIHQPLAVTGCSYCLNKTAYKLTPTCTECGHDMLTAHQLEAAHAVVDQQVLAANGGAK